MELSQDLQKALDEAAMAVSRLEDTVRKEFPSGVRLLMLKNIHNFRAGTVVEVLDSHVENGGAVLMVAHVSKGFRRYLPLATTAPHLCRIEEEP